MNWMLFANREVQLVVVLELAIVLSISFYRRWVEVIMNDMILMTYI